MTKEIAVKITKIKKPRITKNGKHIVDLIVKNLSTSEYMDVACFTNSDNDFPFNEKDEVTMGITVSQFNKKDQYSTGIERIAPMVAPETEVPQGVWDKKDRRMVRMNALAHAVEIFKVSKENKEEGYNTIVECVKDISGQLETWVYNGMED